MWNENDYLKFKRNFAWRVYKYFIANPKLQNNDKNKALFEKARTITIENLRTELSEYDDEAIELAMFVSAHLENKKNPDRLELNEFTESLLE